MDRPALKRLLADIEAGEIDCLVAYKIDRLSRSLLDFARIIGIFEEHHVSFVSITQQFNSATSMGRLVLNVLINSNRDMARVFGEFSAISRRASIFGDLSLAQESRG